METITKRITNAYGKDEFVLVPPADIIEETDGYVVICDMPGVAPNMLDITVENDRLEITGKQGESQPVDKSLRYAEFTLRDYKRQFFISEEIDTTRISAHLDNGVLTINLPKREEAKPRKIEITH